MSIDILESVEFERKRSWDILRFPLNAIEPYQIRVNHLNTIISYKKISKKAYDYWQANPANLVDLINPNSKNAVLNNTGIPDYARILGNNSKSWESSLSGCLSFDTRVTVYDKDGNENWCFDVQPAQIEDITISDYYDIEQPASNEYYVAIVEEGMKNDAYKITLKEAFNPLKFECTVISIEKILGSVLYYYDMTYNEKPLFRVHNDLVVKEIFLHQETI